MTLAREDETMAGGAQNGASETVREEVQAAAERLPGAEDLRREKLIEVAIGRHEVVATLLARGTDALAEADFVHDLRVATRRLEEVARLIATRRLLDKPAAKAVEASLKGLRRSMGDLRDLDVTREHLTRWRMPAAVKQVAEELAAGLENERGKLAAAAAEHMRSPSVTGAMVVLARVLEEFGKAQAAQEMERELEAGIEAQAKRREKQLRRAFGQAAKKQTARALHEARIAAKKLRYVLELADGAGTMEEAGRKVKFLKKVQELLGDHHDTHVILERVGEHLKDRREEAIGGLAPAWQKWRGQMEKSQARRAAEFFAKSYTWMNG